MADLHSAGFWVLYMHDSAGGRELPHQQHILKSSNLVSPKHNPGLYLVNTKVF